MTNFDKEVQGSRVKGQEEWEKSENKRETNIKQKDVRSKFVIIRFHYKRVQVHSKENQANNTEGEFAAAHTVYPIGRLPIS